MPSLEGKIALVTGAGRGIGQAVARLLAEQGAETVCAARTEAQLEETVASIRQAGGKALSLAGDITQEAFVGRLFESIRGRFGRLDILVNNAGMAPFGPVEELSAEKFRQCLELNVLAVFICLQQAVRLMKATGGEGKIINIGSVRSHWTEAGDGGAYNASKYAVLGLTESVARQLHGSGCRIAVGMVCPGVADTPLTNPAREPRPDWLAPETVARAVLHALTAPPDVNVFDTTLFPMSQRPW
ncbi:MAG: SDR family oxidoreductase [Armatimonadetes bacterium]|nr:SDR family oxidoreductase [Armatimonadota bacterium]